MKYFHVAAVRWLLFILVGLPFQMMLYLLYPLFYAYFRFVVVPYRQKDGHVFNYEPNLMYKNHPDHDPSATRDGGVFLDNTDPHNALTHWALWASTGFGGVFGMTLLSSRTQKTVFRLSENNVVNSPDTSGDCLVSWCFAYTQLSYGERAQLKSSVLAVAEGYLKYLGCLSLAGKSKGWVSNRCNNFGINYCPDDFPVGQPAGGPQFYTSLSIFALAAKVGGFKWKAVYWIFWLLMGGWYWAWWPFICVRNNGLGYVRDITMKALYVNKWCFGPKWWITKPMEEITYVISECRNEFFVALMGQKLRHLPPVIDPWMFQKTDAKAPEKLSRDANSYMPYALIQLSRQSQEINKRNRGW